MKLANLFLEILCFLLLSVLILAFLYNKEYEVCGNYQTQSEAKRAYDKGAKQLDGDNDGIPCEELPIVKTVRYYK